MSGYEATWLRVVEAAIGDTVTLPVAWNSNGVKRENVTGPDRWFRALLVILDTATRAYGATQPTSLRRTDHGRKSNDYVEGEVSGRSAGWTAPTSKTPTATGVPAAQDSLDAVMAPTPTTNRDGWLAGYPVGVKRFRADQFEDGTRADGEN